MELWPFSVERLYPANQLTIKSTASASRNLLVVSEFPCPTSGVNIVSGSLCNSISILRSFDKILFGGRQKFIDPCWIGRVKFNGEVVLYSSRRDIELMKTSCRCLVKRRRLSEDCFLNMYSLTLCRFAKQDDSTNHNARCTIPCTVSACRLSLNNVKQQNLSLQRPRRRRYGSDR